MNAPNYDFNFANEKPDIREVIPAGTPLYIQMGYSPGGVGPGGALTKSKAPSDTEYLKAEFTVLRGPYKGRKFWSNMTISGGELDEKGKSKAGGITRKTIRLILDSAHGLSSKDDSPEAGAKRALPNGFASLQGLRFVALAKVEPPQNGYPAKNQLGSVLTVDMKNYPTADQLDNPPQVGSPRQAASPAVPPTAWTGNGTQQAQAEGPIVVPQQATPAAPTTGAFAPQNGAAAIPPAAQQNGAALPAWMK